MTSPTLDIEALKADPERDAFEEWYCVDAYETGGPIFAPLDIAAMRQGDGYDIEYVSLASKWEGWKARAIAAEARTAELVAQRDGLVEAARSFIPTNLALDNANVPDDLVIPLDVAMAEFRALAAALSTIKAGGAE